MNLLPKYVLDKFPAIGSTENQNDPQVICKFFLVGSKWIWYGIEFDGKDLFFGYVAGEFPELGYFSLLELQTLKGPMGLGIERDRYFRACRLSEIKKKHEPEV